VAVATNVTATPTLPADGPLRLSVAVGGGQLGGHPGGGGGGPPLTVYGMTLTEPPTLTLM
jgi:hypothetical protein